LSGLVVLGYPYSSTQTTGRGIDRHLFNLQRGLRRRGIPFDSVDAGHYPNHALQLLLGEPKIHLRVAREKGDLWYAISPVGGRVAAVLGRRPLVTTIHDVIPFYNVARHPARYRFLRACIRICCRLSDRVTVQNDFTRRFLVDRLDVPDEKISLVRHAPDFAELGDSAPPDALDASEGHRLLFLGSWNPIDRGGDLAIRAMSEIVQQVPDASLLFAAHGPEVGTLRDLSQTLGITQAVRFVGFVPEPSLGKVIRSASVLLYPSRLGISYSMMMAMYCGTPVVTADYLGTGELVGDAGAVCPPDDPAALAAAVVRILSDDRVRRELARKGRDRIRAFSADTMVDQTVAAFRETGWSQPDPAVGQPP